LRSRLPLPIAGLAKAVSAGWIDPEATVVALITGHGLKDVDAALERVAILRPVEPSLDAVRAALAAKP
jgi:threonine synthase